MNKKILTILILINILISGYSLYSQPGTEIENFTEPNELTHGNSTDPNYNVVFDNNKVHEIDIVITEESWSIMQDDLENNISNDKDNRGPRGNQRPPIGDVPEGERPPMGDVSEGERPPMGDVPEGERPPMGDVPEGERPPMRDMQNSTTSVDSTEYSPVWVESTIVYNDSIWEHVGIRYKGNSSLNSTYNSGIGKFSFKLSFDKFEDDYTDTKNQRFYGFKQLNLNNNYSDQTFLREKVAADLFREFGLVSSETAFYAVYVNHGEGREYYGLYTLVEEMDDTVLDTQLGDDSGNLYKPDGTAATFQKDSYNESELYKKSNESEGDFSDIYMLYETINSEDRVENYDLWKGNLENIFDVDGFLKWLAANTIMQNWDTYGNSTRNYYLYNNPETGLLTWIPWDNNEALQRGRGANYDLSYSQITDKWPLIKYLLEDSEYKIIYDSYLESFIDSVFTIDKMEDTYDQYYDLIKTFVYSEESKFTFLRSKSSFDYGITSLKEHVLERNNEVLSYLDK